MEPTLVTCNYEGALHGAVIQKFHETIVKVNFYLKQVLHNTMQSEKYRLPKEEVKQVMMHNTIDIFTIILPKDILQRENLICDK